MAQSLGRRGSIDLNPPYMRIVLLGKNVSENSEVGNFILGRAAFDSEAPSDVVERISGRLKDRRVTVINSPQLLQTNISDHQITQTVRECVSLSDPGPHAFILVLQHKDFTEEDRYRVKIILKEFSEQAIKRTIVITTDEDTHNAKDAPVKANELIQQLNTECGGGYLALDNETEELHSVVFQRLENILKEYHREFLKYEQGKAVDKRHSRFLGSVRTDEEDKDSDADDDGKQRDTHTKKKAKEFPFHGNKSVPRKQKLNLLLCGSDGRLKVTVSDLIRGKKELHGRVISVVELPAVHQLSEEEVMCQTFNCLSLCDPGVHVFLFIIPDAPLTKENKLEMEEIQRIFSKRLKHIMILIFQDKSKTGKSSLYHIETFIQTFGVRHFVLENCSQLPALLQDLESMVQESKGSFYTTFMYLQDQVELERSKHRAEMEELKRSLMKLQPTTAAVPHDDDLRIVLLGKTGVGKSATGNTILKRPAFKSLFDPSSVTRECQKEITEFNRRPITVIDTPGLFDTGVDNAETRKEIVKCVSMAAPGPHVFLLVIQLGRFTKEEKKAVKMIQETFGEKSRIYTMVLFTRGDELRGRRIEDFIERDGSLKNITQQFGKRYHVFNNSETEDQTQVSELLEKIDRMVAKNGGSFYTNEMFQMVEKNIKEEQERILKEKEEEIKRKEKELKTKYEAEIEQMKEEKERERQESQYKLRQKEEEFKKKEEEIKKEKDEQQENFIKYLEQKHDKEKQNLLEKIQLETREQAEREYLVKLEKEVARALEEAEAKVPYRSKRARDWGYYVPVAGAAAGGAVGTIEDIVKWIIKK